MTHIGTHNERPVMSQSPWARSAGWRGVSLVGLVSSALLLSSLQAVTLAAPQSPSKPPAPNLGSPVPVRRDGSPAAAASAPVTSASVVAPPAALPVAGSYQVALPIPAKGQTHVVGSAAQLSAAATSAAVGPWQGVGSTGISLASRSGGVAGTHVGVQVLDRATATRYGDSGLALLVTTAGAEAGANQVAVRVPSRMLQGLYGADFASRVRWVQTPITPPATAAQQPHAVGRPPGLPTTVTSQAASSSLPAQAVGSASQIVAAVADAGSESIVVSPSTTSRSFVLAAVSTGAASNGTGSFAASPLRSSSSWQVSAQSGDFSWSYPLATPPAAAGPSPNLALSYDSQSTDGQTGSTNNQTSELGQGWDLSGGGLIERSYVPCASDDGASGPVGSSGDLCWSTDNATVSFAGHSGQLVRAANGAWRLAGDDGNRFEYLTGASNGTHDGGYWRLTTTDGTQYFFGRNQLPGWTAGDPTTASAWTVPVFGNDAGEPCHAATFAASSCAQGWRWNLDYVLDTHGNSEAFYYQAETNYYHSVAGPAAYIRGGFLLHIDYGMRTGHEFDTPAAERVVFDNVTRCLTACTSHANWPDTPWDLVCASAACAGVGGQSSPTFFTGQRFGAIHTQVLAGSAYRTVDTWTMQQSFPPPGDGTSPALWLARIFHTGSGATPASSTTTGPGSISTPVSVFYGLTMQNRVWAVDGLAPLDKYRISSIDTETGAVVAIDYSPQECSPTHKPAAPQSNTMRCFPQWWTPHTTPPQPAQLDWFHKYVVNRVVNDPRTGGPADARQENDYLYLGTPAWRFDTSAGAGDDSRNWSVWAGYSQVEVRTGDSNDPARQKTTDYTFFRGLDGDADGPPTTPTSATRSVVLTASNGAQVRDSLWWAGRVFEQLSRNGASPGGAASVTPVLSDTVNSPWVSASTASSSRSYTTHVGGGTHTGAITVTAQLTGDGAVATVSPLSTGGQRGDTVITTHDTYGRVTSVQDAPSDAPFTCTRTSYATNTTDWLLAYPSQTSEVAGACSASPSYPADAISASAVYYDGSSILGAAPTTGVVTRTDTATGYSSSGAPTWQTTSLSTYDALGRVISQTDPRTSPAATTRTAYMPAGAGPLTQTVVTNPLGWTAATSYDPAWGAVTSTTDANGNTTTATYDALGRRSQVWLPTRLRADNPSDPSISYAYTLSSTAPNTVETTTVVATGSVVSSYALYDGLGQIRQTQAPAESGGIDVVDTTYNAIGQVGVVSAPYYATGNPSTTLLVPTTSLPSRTQTLFDGAGRLITSILLANNQPAWRTSYAYLGVDRVDMTPPAGGTPTTTYTNSRGKTTQLVQYLAATPTGTAIETTRYGFDARGDMTSMTNPAGSAWSWSFDVQGRQVSASDPDTGVSTTSYYPDGDLQTSTDAVGNALTYTYDSLHRKTAEYAGTSTAGVEQAAWTYDTATRGKGQPASSIRYVGGIAGQPGTGTVYRTSTGGYSSLGSPTSTTIDIGGTSPLAGSYTTTYGYSVNGHLYTQGDPAEGGLPAEHLQYGYDGLDMPGGVGSDLGSYVEDLTYTHLDQIAQTFQYNGAVQWRTFGWDSATSRMTELLTQRMATNNAIVSDDKYSYDPAGNMLSDTNATPATGTDTQCFSYDHLQNLTSAWTPASGSCPAPPSSAGLGGPAPYWTSYVVDPASGNRTSSTEHAASAGGVDQRDTYMYPLASGARPNAVVSVSHATAPAGGVTFTPSGSDSYAYNADGSTTALPGQGLSYDVEGHLASTTLIAGGARQSNVYDADGNLLVQSDPVTGSTAYLGDTQLHVAAGSAVVTGTRTYTALGQALAERDTTIGGPVGGKVYFLDPTPNNTAVAYLDTTNAAVTRRYTDPFGNHRGPSTPWTSDHGYLNAPNNTFTLTPGVQATMPLGARNYDPTTGKFLSVDPVLAPSSPQQVNGYSYASNNPVTGADPSGLMVETDSGSTDCSKGQCVQAAIDAGYADGVNAGLPMPSFDEFNRQVHNPAGVGGFKDILAGAVHLAGTIGDAASMTCVAGHGVCSGSWASHHFDQAVGADPNSIAYGTPDLLGLIAVPGEEIEIDSLGIADDATTAGRAAKNAGELGAPFELTAVGDSVYESPAGLRYGTGSVHGHRLSHVLQHAFENPEKPIHSVWSGGSSEVFQTIDEAWMMRGNAVLGDDGKFVVPMGRPIGTNGETGVTIIVKPGTSDVITAFPS
jgi:RHS repeat-associated protein